MTVVRWLVRSGDGRILGSVMAFSLGVAHDLAKAKYGTGVTTFNNNIPVYLDKSDEGRAWWMARGL